MLVVKDKRESCQKHEYDSALVKDGDDVTVLAPDHRWLISVQTISATTNVLPPTKTRSLMPAHFLWLHRYKPEQPK
jgi:hypothetical protein